MPVIKEVKNQIKKKSLPFLETRLTLLFCSFLVTQPKTKAEPPVEQRQD